MCVSGAMHARREHATLVSEATRTRQLFARTHSLQRIDDLIRSNLMAKQSASTNLFSALTRDSLEAPGASPVRGFVQQARGPASLRVITQGNRMVLKQFHPKSKLISKSIPQPQVREYLLLALAY